MLKLAVFNLIKYSFNMKTWVSDRASKDINSLTGRPQMTLLQKHYVTGNTELPFSKDITSLTGGP